MGSRRVFDHWSKTKYVNTGQCSVLNDEFSPDPAEVERAEKMIAAYDAAYTAGLGAVQFEGAMIDVPVVQRARTVLTRAAAIRRRTGA